MNFRKRQEQDKKRNGLFESGLDKFYKKDIQGVSYSHAFIGPWIICTLSLNNTSNAAHMHCIQGLWVSLHNLKVSSVFLSTLPSATGEQQGFD